MKLYLHFHLVLVIVTNLTGVFASNKYHLPWDGASSQCDTKHSQLVPQRYINEKDLTKDIIKGIGNNTSAWIDGKIQDIGCTKEVCLRMKKVSERVDRKLPYLCVTPDGVHVNTQELSFKESMSACGSVKRKINDSLQNAMLSKFNEIHRKYITSTVFWLPNVDFSDKQDTTISCVYVIPRNNISLEVMNGDCGSPRMGVCMKNTYLWNYQKSVIVEMSTRRFASATTVTTLATEGRAFTTVAIEGRAVTTVATKDVTKIGEIEIVGPGTKFHRQWGKPSLTRTAETVVGIEKSPNWDVKSPYWDVKSLFALALSSFSLVLVFVSMIISIAMWKRLSTKLYLMTKEGYAYSALVSSKSKHNDEIHNEEYEELQPATQCDKTRRNPIH